MYHVIKSKFGFFLIFHILISLWWSRKIHLAHLLHRKIKIIHRCAGQHEKSGRAFPAFTTTSGKSFLTNTGLRKAEVWEGEIGYPECTFKGTESSQSKNQLKWVMISPSRCISIFSNCYYSCSHLKEVSLSPPQVGPICHLLLTSSRCPSESHNHKNV